MFVELVLVEKGKLRRGADAAALMLRPLRRRRRMVAVVLFVECEGELLWRM